jgi:lysozyme family protein
MEASLRYSTALANGFPQGAEALRAPAQRKAEQGGFKVSV